METNLATKPPSSSLKSPTDDTNAFAGRGRSERRPPFSNVVGVLRQLEQVHGGRHDSLDQHVVPAAECDRSLRADAAMLQHRLAIHEVLAALQALGVAIFLWTTKDRQTLESLGRDLRTASCQTWSRKITAWPGLEQSP